MLEPIRALPAYQRLKEDIESREELAGLSLPRSARLPVSAALFQDLSRPILLVTNRADLALRYLDELALWLPDDLRLYFPEPTPMFYEQAAWGSATRRERLLGLTALAMYHIPAAADTRQPPLIITTARALMTRTLPRRDFIRYSKTIKRGQEIAPDTLVRSWVDIGYLPAEIVVEAGQFSRRGGILDIWPPSEPMPVRFEFFGDEIDTLRQFDPATQRTLQYFESLLITPAR
ncbi:MAG: hypothetical protein HGA53_08935, partial [Anaerolineaceae bacterium]|nr:hypothetical protein [Anaerolineaceae bacterium]